MRHIRLRLIALFLVLALLLSGCGTLMTRLLEEASTVTPTAIQDLEYTRPTQADLQESLDVCKALAKEGRSIDELVDAIYVFYDAYDLFLTNCAIADLRYYADTTDSYWSEENNWCTNNLHLADAALEELYYALAKSPLLPELESEENFGAGFFDSYQGDAEGMDPRLLALFEKESAYLNDYYALMGQFDGDYQSDAYLTQYQMQFAQLYADLIRVRQEIAAFCGYDDYADYAYELTYGRDYTPQQAEAFMLELSDALYAEYTAFDTYTLSQQYCTEAQTFSYVKNAAQTMGGDIWEAFRYLDENRLYDISYGPNKYDISYEIFLWGYGFPVLFMAPYQDQSDLLTFSHEFGHFVNDYVCAGSYAGIDVAEVHSQALEYLSLLYGEPPEGLTRYKLYDSLCTYMETSAYSLFEYKAYQLTGTELTSENLIKLADETAAQFGFDSWGGDGRDFVTVGHFYTHPMYMFSYVVSNDLAMQFYQLELEQPGQGLALYEECVYSQDSYLIAFAQQYGLESPFAEGRAAAIAKTFRDALR